MKAITESTALANRGMHFDSTKVQVEFEPHDFPDGNITLQHGRDARLADVDSAPSNDRTVARINPEGNFQFEAGMAASVHYVEGFSCPRVIITFQFLPP